MTNFLQTIKSFFSWQNKDFRVFVFTVFNAAILLVTKLLADITDPTILAFMPFLIPFMNYITKQVNMKFFGDM
jgi:hypothetical protein